MSFKMKIVRDMPFEVTTTAIGAYQAAVYVIAISEDSFLPSSRWALSARAAASPEQVYWLGSFADSEADARATAQRSWDANDNGDQRTASIISAIVTSGGGKIL